MLRAADGDTPCSMRFASLQGTPSLPEKAARRHRMRFCARRHSCTVLSMTLKTRTLPLFAGLCGLLCGHESLAARPWPTAGSGACLVQDGQPRAQIVIAQAPPRTTQLAAQELQTCLEKISGAKLPIVTEPTTSFPVRIFVGASPWTEKLNLPTDALKYGAYRIVAGDDWMALIGDDTDFTPIEPWPRNNGDWASGKIQAAWDKITGAQWGNPMPGLYKHYLGRASVFGKPKNEPADKSSDLPVWGFDERGSFNAVCGFLASLGARWYLPGELGEVLPSLKTIPLPKIDETVHPDFAVRRVNIRFATHGRDTALWAMHLGLRDPFNIQVAHGMTTMTDRREIMEAHPDWFALYGGKRATDLEQKNNQLCYSNEELFRETVRYVRTLFDHYHLDVVSIMPPDGYTAICQCPLCQGKDTPERDDRGRLSDYVWDFVNRVAREVGKTHPNKKVMNCAYGVYTLPPLKIAKLEPNVQVCIVGGRRPVNNKHEQQEETRKLREAWVAKTDNPLMIFENYPFTDRGFYLPAFTPHAMGASINATKGLSMGEDIWLSGNFNKVGLGFNHFQIYFTERMWWGGKTQDVDALFDEYCRLCYGPAAKQMKAFFEYSEANWQEMEKDKAKVDRALDLFAAAKQKASPESVYARRIALVDDFLKDLRSKSELLGQKRGPVPSLRLARDAAGIVIDGNLDDPFWRECLVQGVGNLRELETGRQPTFGTTFKAAWGKDGQLYLAIRCEDRPGEPLNIGTTRRGDPALWYGDAIEVLLETESHSYYQIAVNPAGAVCHIDRGAPRASWSNWDSQAEVATRVTNGYWTVEMRIPVTRDENDPLHKVIGRKPTSSLPWHFNLCRQRVRDHGTEASAFSPTGKESFHVPMKFAQLFEGRSHVFGHDPTVTDYLVARRKAVELAMRDGKRQEAMTALIALADGTVTDLQKSDALEQAATYARLLKQTDLADQLAARIPLPAVARTVRMQNLLAARKPKEVIAQFAGEDIAVWPFWKKGDGYFARGTAWSATGQGQKAEEDLTRALETVTEGLERANILEALGDNREINLHDDARALDAYRQIADMQRLGGSATWFHAVQRTAHLLSKQGKYAEAEAVLGKVKIDALSGTWRGTMLLELAATLHAAGKKEAALAACRKLLDDPTAPQGQRSKAEDIIASLATNIPPAAPAIR
jgi:tetratricopeptide (TPR) repeat protein